MVGEAKAEANIIVLIRPNVANPYNRITILDRILARSVMADHGCQLWTGATNGEQIPYGRIKLQGHLVLVHRAVWEAIKGPIPEGMEIGRTCRNSLCIQVDHMFLFARKVAVGA